jgi:hypothetical protein
MGVVEPATTPLLGETDFTTVKPGVMVRLPFT